MKQKFEWSFASFTDLAGKFPFRIRSCGRGLIRQGILPKPRTLHSLEVLWCTDGVFQVEFPEGKYTMQPGYVCYYMPGETHIFDAPPGDGGQYCFVAFEGNFSCEFLKRFNITRLPITPELVLKNCSPSYTILSGKKMIPVCFRLWQRG